MFFTHEVALSYQFLFKNWVTGFASCSIGDIQIEINFDSTNKM